MSTNLVPIAEAALKALRDYGAAQLLYLTSEFSPYSSQQKPDILFSCRTPTGAEQHFFIELAPALGTQAREGLVVEAIAEHRAFVQSTSEVNVQYAIAASDSIAIPQRVELDARGITVLPLESTGEQLAAAIMEWVNREIGSAVTPRRS